MSAPNLCRDCDAVIPADGARCIECITKALALGPRERLAFAHAQLTGRWESRPAPGSHHHHLYTSNLLRAADEVGLLPLCTSIVRNLRPGART